VTLVLDPGAPKEVEIVRWLSTHLVPQEWLRVLGTIGKQRLLTFPLSVLGLSVRAQMIVGEVYRVQTLADLTKLSQRALQGNMHSVAFDALMRKVELFRLDLRA
jgi:hypothetical protein